MESQTNQRLATTMANQCIDVKNVNQMTLYKLTLEKSYASSDGITAMVNRYSLGKPSPFKYSKTILLMGATGTGKSTWINAMINYVLGVEFEDDFRFVLIDEEVRGGSQAHSQTQGVNVYDIHYQKGFRIPFSLTIVDTPGFGDIGGIQRDVEITSAIADLFQDKNGIVELDAVGFVVKCSDARLTHSQKYIFHSILSIFGKEIRENICFLATFADGKRPAVLEAIKKTELPFRLDSKGSPCHQKFNNGALYVNNQDDDDEMSPIEWKNGMKNFKLFFEELSIMPTKSLQMTKEVLEDRKQLEMKLEWMQDALQHHLTRIEELQSKEAVIKLHNTAVINQNDEIKRKVVPKKELLEEIDEFKDLLYNGLKQIALSGEQLTAVQCIRMIIENEKKELKEGSVERIKIFEELLPLAKLTVLSKH